MKLELETKFEIGQLVTLAGMAEISDGPCVFAVNLYEVHCFHESDVGVFVHCRLVRDSTQSATEASVSCVGFRFLERELVPYEKNPRSEWMCACSLLKNILDNAKYDKVSEQDFDSASKLREAADVLKAMADKAK